MGLGTYGSAPTAEKSAGTLGDLSPQIGRLAQCASKKGLSDTGCSGHTPQGMNRPRFRGERGRPGSVSVPRCRDSTWGEGVRDACHCTSSGMSRAAVASATASASRAGALSSCRGMATRQGNRASLNRFTPGRVPTANSSQCLRCCWGGVPGGSRSHRDAQQPAASAPVKPSCLLSSKPIHTTHTRFGE